MEFYDETYWYYRVNMALSYKKKFFVAYKINFLTKFFIFSNFFGKIFSLSLSLP